MWLPVLISSLAVAWCAWLTATVLTRPVMRVDQAWAFEDVRRSRLMAASRTYRWFHPLVDEWQGSAGLQIPGLSVPVERSLRQRGSRLPWRPGEYLATTLLEALGVAVVVGTGWWLSGGAALESAWWGLIAACGTVYSILWILKRRARRHVAEFVSRLPFALDGIAMLLQVGAGIEEAFETMARESSGHATGFELTELNQAIRRGTSFRQALEDLRTRFDEVEIREPLGAIISSSELGTPLSEVLRILAHQMRQKRMQQVETIAAQAHVAIEYPAFLILLACMLVIMVPFVATALVSWFRSGL
ncbi:MAG: type II secretion system F family protein [Planctomycetes bacterium]|nr:type II secretion system F family protein [Planctomycetota bacterium]